MSGLLSMSLVKLAQELHWHVVCVACAANKEIAPGETVFRDKSHYTLVFWLAHLIGASS